MLARKHRFHRRNAVRFVYRKGQNVRGQFVSAHFVLGQRHDSYRAGVVVSKKVSKKAVVRNRIRRRIYELLRKQPQLLPSGTDLIITVFNEQLATMPAAELESQIVETLSKISDTAAKAAS